MRMCKRLLSRSLAASMAVLALAYSALAIKPDDSSQLETPKTHWDQPGMWKYDGFNRVVDERDGRIQSVSQLREGPYKGTPEQAAREFLLAHQAWLGLDPSEKNLRVALVQESPMGNHVTFERVIDGVVVYPGNLVVTLSNDNYVLFYFSSLYIFTDLVNTTAALPADNAKRISNDYLRPANKAIFESEPELVVWAGDNRDFSTCWRYRVNYTEPYGDWEVLVEASSGRIRRVVNQAVAVDGAGYVFDPEPLTTSGQSYGAAGYVDNNDANSAQLQGQRMVRTLQDILAIPLFGNTFYYLTGPYCDITDIEVPNVGPVVQVNNSTFNYTRDNESFEDVLCYFHIDQSHRWMASLGFNGVQNNSMQVDPHAENFGCNAHYHPSGNYLTFGDGPNDVDASEDAEVVLHEYGHGINQSIVPGWGGGDEGSMGEGWGDYWGASYGRSVNSSWQANWIGSWGLHNCFGGRSLQAGLHYPEDNNIEVHYSGQIWSQALYEAEVNMNSRTVMNTLGLQHQYALGTSASMLTAAQAIITADINLYSGAHLYAISDAFVPRGLLTRPGNDVCPGYAIYSFPYSDNGSTITANQDYTNSVSSVSPDVVYTIYPQDCDQNVTVSLCGSTYDTGLSIRTGGACPGTTEVTYNDDFCGGPPARQSQLTFNLTAGETYYVIINGWSTYAGNYTLNISGVPTGSPPANDTCPGTAITSLPYADNGNTCPANNDYANCITSNSRDVFYNLTLGTCQTVTVSLCGSGYDCAVEVRRGGGCPGAQPVACNDDFCGLQSQTSFVAAAGVTYYIIVSGFFNHAGPYTINVTGVPYVAPNDQCPGTVIAALPYSNAGNTTCAGHDFNNCGSNNSPDVIFQYTPTACENVTASLCLSEYDTRIDVYKGDTCPGDVFVACNDDACGLNSQATFYAAAGVTYYIRVGGFGGSSGFYGLNVTSVPATPPNDACGGAIAITTLPYEDWGSTACAANNYVNCVGSASNDVVYRLNFGSVPPCGTVTVSTCGSNYDTGLEIMTGSACPGSIPVGCDDDSPCDGFATLQSNIIFAPTPGVDYWIKIHGFFSYSGTYHLTVKATCEPESLVIQPVGNDAQLFWAPPGGMIGGYANYKIYRAATPNVPIIAANLIGTSAVPSYNDAGRLSNAAIASFYAVTADLTYLNLQDDGSAGDAAIASLPDGDKVISAAESDALKLNYVPAFITSESFQTPVQDKVDDTAVNEHNSTQFNPYPQNPDFPANPK